MFGFFRRADQTNAQGKIAKLIGRLLEVTSGWEHVLCVFKTRTGSHKVNKVTKYSQQQYVCYSRALQ